MTRWWMGVAMAVAGAVALGGCSRSEPEQPALPENATEPAVVASPEPAPVAPSPTPTPSATPTPEAAPPPPPEVQPDEQMLEDASATGMTARSARDEEPAEAPPANAEAP